MANWQDLERWPHQKRGVRDVTEAIDGGGRRIVLTAPTGAGKSLMLFDLIRWADERNWPVAAYVNRTMLFDQLSENLEKWGIDHGKRARGHDPALLNDVQLAMTQTELSKVYRNKKRELHRAKIVLVDECFVAGTRVLTTHGQKSIERIRPGDIVYCASGVGTVESTSSRFASDIYLLEFSDGSKLRCTGNHRIFTGRGWIAASALVDGEIAWGPEDVSYLWKAVCSAPMGQCKGERVCHRRRLLDQPEDLLADLLKEVQEPNGLPSFPHEDDEDDETSRSQAYQAGREWAIASLAPACAIARARRGMGGRGRNPIRAAERERVSNVLQSGFSESVAEDCDRNRRGIALHDSEEVGGRKESDDAPLTRLVRVSRIESDCAVPVFNIHVSGHPSYFANGHLVHNCHNQTGDVMKRIIQDHVDAGAAVVGVTATPLDLEGIYEELIQAGTTSELRDCGALVPAYTYGPDEPDTRHIKRQKTGEFSYGDVKKVIMTQTIFGRVFEWWKKLNPDERPALLFAPGVKESLWFAQEFESRKVRAAHIDGDQIYIDNKTMPSTSENRAMLAEESREGRLPIVCNRFVMREGIDWPWLYHGIFATVFGSLTSFIQSGGRLLRAHPSLKHVVIQDHGGGWWRHGSLNADRIWKLGQGALELSNERFERLRNKTEPEPILCPRCCRPRLSGPECPGCGYTHTTKSRMVVQADGSLVPYRGDIFKPRVVREESDTIKKWLAVYYRCKNAKRPMTFTQAVAVFKQEHGYYPPATLPMMPKSDVDAHRQINSVKYGDLIPREKPQAVSEPQATLFT